MTLEQMLATPSVVAALVVVAVVVFVVAFLLGRRRGFQDVQDGVDPNDPSLFGAAKNTSLFGPRVPVQSTERQLVAVMPEACGGETRWPRSNTHPRPRGASASSTTRRWRSRKSATS